MIIKARHHWFYYPFFKGYARLMTRLDFRSVNYHAEWDSPGAGNAATTIDNGMSLAAGVDRIAGDTGQDNTVPAGAPGEDSGGSEADSVGAGRDGEANLPVFMIGNHFSWWDGFIALNINQRYFRKKFHIMMLEEQLRDRMFLNKAGAYSLNKGHRSMVETFSYTGELLSDPGNMVVMYPQGRICSVYDRPLEFERGWYRIIERLAQPVQVVYYHALVDYFDHRKPQMNIFVYKVDHTGKHMQDMEDEFNRLLEKSLEKHRASL